MRARLPWILFGLSLLLNVFFVAGALHDDILSDHPERAERGEVIESIAAQLKLSDAQRRALADYRRNVIVDLGKKRAAESADRVNYQAMLAEMRRPRFQPEAVAALLGQRYDRRIEFWVDKASALHAYLQTLSPEQRAGFLALAEDRDFFRRLFGQQRP